MPAVTVCVAGDAEIVKSGVRTFTTNVAGTQCVRVPSVPQTVNGLEPPAVLLAVETFSVELPDPATAAGLKLPLAPVGSPLTLNDTVLLKPLRAVTVTVYVVALPAFTVRDEGEIEIVKSGIPVTTRVTVVECAKVAVAPVIVSV